MRNSAWIRWTHKTNRAECIGYPWQPCEQQAPGPSHWKSVETKMLAAYSTYHAKRDGKLGLKSVKTAQSEKQTRNPQPPHILTLGGQLLAGTVSCNFHVHFARYKIMVTNDTKMASKLWQWWSQVQITKKNTDQDMTFSSIRETKGFEIQTPHPPPQHP